MTDPARLCAAFVALLTAAALLAQVVVAVGQPALGGPFWALWRMAAFFTVLTNLAVLVLFTALAAGRPVRASRIGAVLLSIAMVGLIYHLVLADLWAPSGLDWWADQGLHSAVPVAVALWWFGFAPKALRYRDVPGWLVGPLIYCVYALIRGRITGFWPYPFLDLDDLGPAMLAASVAALVVGFAGFGAGIVALARVIR